MLKQPMNQVQGMVQHDEPCVSLQFITPKSPEGNNRLSLSLRPRRTTTTPHPTPVKTDKEQRRKGEGEKAKSPLTPLC